MTHRLAVPPFTSRRAIRTPRRRRCALPATFPVAACCPLAASLYFLVVILACSLSRLRWRTILTVSPPLTARWQHVASNPLPSAQASCHAIGLLAVLPCAIHSPHRWSARPAAIPGAVCHPVAVPAVCYPRPDSGRHVPAAWCAGRMLSPQTFPSPCTLGSAHNLSGPTVASAHHTGGLLAPLPIRVPHAICSPRRQSTFQ
jgi:hypothetical protein